MTTWRRVVGDLDDTLDMTVHGIDDATAASWSANIWNDETPATTVTATALYASTIRVELGGWISGAAPGYWNIEAQADLGAGRLATWPEGDPDTIIVRASGL